jgi:hypothetical protein
MTLFVMALLLYACGHFYAQYAVASLNANATNGDSYFVVETINLPSLLLADLPLLLVFAGRLLLDVQAKLTEKFKLKHDHILGRFEISQGY